jgi:hypothetical protein
VQLVRAAPHDVVPGVTDVTDVTDACGGAPTPSVG